MAYVLDTETLQNVIGGIIVVATAIFAARKKISDDSTDIEKNKAEIDIIESIKEQRDSAILEQDKCDSKLDEMRDAYNELLKEFANLQRELNDKNSTIAELKSRVAILTELVTRLTNVIDAASSNIDEIVQADNS